MEDTLEGDFVNLVKTDFQVMEIPFNIAFVETTTMNFFKSSFKKKIQKAALKYVQNIQQGQSKVKDIKYDVLEIQPYLTSPMFSDEETQLLHSLRIRTADHFKANFRNQYGGKVNCPLNCWGEDEQPNEDTHQHLLMCAKASTRNYNSRLGNRKSQI